MNKKMNPYERCRFHGPAGFWAVVAMLVLAPAHLPAQTMTLDEVIAEARANSVAALSARATFVSDYWAYRSYKASRLPSLAIYGNLASFDRSLRQLQNFETGEVVYTENYNMQNSLGLLVTQNVTFTGGTVSLYSDLSRIDQFGGQRHLTWYAQPISFSYSQPIFAYNQFKWDRKISPKEYERAKRAYIESMESITIDAAKYYFELLLAKRNHEKSRTNFENTRMMLSVARMRVGLGSVTRDEYLQLELGMLNDSIRINETAVKVREAQMMLNSLLGYDETCEISPVLDDRLPDVWMDYDMVMGKALENSSFLLENEIKTLTAESGIARAKAERGASVSFNARFGLTNSAEAFRETYRNLLDQEVLGLSFTIPIFDWGQGEGRVKKAKARAEVVKAEVEQAENDFRRNVFTAVGQFNNQKQQCGVSRRASEIGLERYNLVMDKFRSGNASVMELNTARQEYDEAMDRYVNDMNTFWSLYYDIRKTTLYDFIAGKDIDVDFDELIK